jgi:hypothetical protein
MKTIICIGLMAVLLPFVSGCLISGQIRVTQIVDIGVTTDSQMSSYCIDLNEDEDYADHKSDIKSVDALSLVAYIENNTQSDLKAQIYFSNDPNLSTLAEIKDNATLVFVSPAIPADSEILINWNDGLTYMQNVDALIAEILGDGVFCLYGVANTLPFELEIDGEVAITLTVGK